MRALRKVAPEPGLALEEVPEPFPAAGEVLVEVEAASICGTDLHIENWDEWASHRIDPPVTLGHEFAGTVVELGADVHHVAVGEYVSAESHITCGVCFHCRTGQAHMCERTQILGVDRDGAFARYVTVPEAVIWKNDRSKLPPEIATLQEPFGNAVFATSEQDLAGRSVAVLGCGPVGLFTVAIAHSSGAAAVVAADLHHFRLALAVNMGADETVDADEIHDVVEVFRALNQGHGFDVVFEMSGSPRAIQDAFRIARNGGRVILFGIPSKPVEIDVAEQLIFKNLDVLAVSGRRIFATWYKTRWLLESGVVDLRPLITHECGLEDFQQAMSTLEAGEACKIVLYPNGTPSRAPETAPVRVARPAETGPARWAHR
ncbi:MAG: L-threonine 3-dehydrogenase [Candidatus Rokuibacteriota bacterium]|nr:MAG: L-threonine 3-dehydrogenase [Candidatus Rokubacteria bacterium]